MKPLASLSAEVARAIRGVVFDIDDTVTRDGRLERVAFDAMWRAHDAGLHLVAATGRPLAVADVVAHHWPVVAAVGENGAGWVYRDASNVTREGYFADDESRGRERALLNRIKEAVAHELPTIKLAKDGHGRRCDVAWDIGEFEHVDEATINALTGVIAREGALSTVSSVHAHAYLVACDKAQGAARAVHDALGRDLATELSAWVFIGDSGNDATAFAYFEHTVGVSNVVEHLPRISVPPKYVCTHDRGRGFAELIDTLLSKRA